jgi:hypothetical protein
LFNLKIGYTYTDYEGKSSYSGGIVLEGSLTKKQIGQILNSLNLPGGEGFFIPSKLSLPHMSPVKSNDFNSFIMAIESAASDAKKDIIDKLHHPWHRILFIERTIDDVNACPTAEYFYTTMLKFNFCQLHGS